MKLTRWVPAAIAGIVISATAVSGQRETPAPAVSPADAASHSGLVAKSCVSCHNDKTKTAGLSLQSLSLTDVPAHGAVWEKVLLKVRSGEMPPPSVRTRPDPAAAAAFASFLERTLDAAAAAKPNPGRAPVHRLNRAEYSNAIRDLLAVDVKPGAWLPVDDSGYGFDNIAAVLSTSPALLERYMTAARRISRLAVGDMTLKPVEDIYDAKRDPVKGTRNERISDDLPFDSRAGISIQHYFPVDGEYVFKIRIPGPPIGENDPEIDPYQVRVPVKAGLHWVGVTSPRENLKVESEGPAGRGGGAGGRGAGVPQVPYPVDLRLNGARVKRFDVPGGTPDVRQLVIGGPYGTSGRGTTASRSKIFTCDPKTAKEESACAKTILTALTRRAFRRPVKDADVQPLLAFYEKGRAASRLQHRHSASARGAARLARFPVPHRTGSGAIHRRQGVSGHRCRAGLASVVLPLEQHSRRSAARPRRTRQAEECRPCCSSRCSACSPISGPRRSSRTSPGSGCICATSRRPRPIRSSFRSTRRCARRSSKETELFVASIIREDRSLLDLLTADHTFVNERLAEHYGIPKVYGSQFRRVTLTDPNRRGLLGKGSILTVTSYPNRTSVVQRGKWILENLLGTPPPPPPADVPELQAKKDGKALSLRAQMEQHRSNAVCASCHARMDPIGFALENYDGVGKWRDEDSGIPHRRERPAAGRHRVQRARRPHAVDGQANTARTSSGRSPRS